MTRPYGWKKQKEDVRDLKFGISAHAGTLLPALVDLRIGMPPVYDQGQTSSCTANAIAGELDYAEGKAGLVNMVPSRLFIYYNERLLEGSTGTDDGGEIRDGIKGCNRWGYPNEALWDFDASKITVKPDAASYAAAASNKIHFYAGLNGNNIYALKTCLAHGWPFIFGFYVFSEFEGDQIAQDGLLPMPKPGEQPIGGHAVIAVGYDDSKQLVTIRNSWGKDWGDKGYFYMPYAYITDDNLCEDFWMIRLK